MTDSPFDDDSSFEREYFGLGWDRWLPDSAPGLYAAVKYLGDSGTPGDLDEQPRDGEFWKTLEPLGGLNGSAFWRGTKPPPIEELAAQDDYRLKVEGVRRTARAVGLKGARSNRQTIELMRRLKLLERIEEEDGAVWWRAVTPLPMPSERIPMSDAERQQEDRLRWQAHCELLAQRILGAVADSGSLAVSLRALARQLSADVEDVRRAVALLLDRHDCSTSVDLRHLSPERSFEIRWTNS